MKVHAIVESVNLDINDGKGSHIVVLKTVLNKDELKELIDKYEQGIGTLELEI